MKGGISLNLSRYGIYTPAQRLKGSLTLLSRILDRVTQNLQSYLEKEDYKRTKDLIYNDHSFERIIKKTSEYSNEPYSIEKQLMILKSSFQDFEKEIRFSLEDYEKEVYETKTS